MCTFSDMLQCAWRLNAVRGYCGRWLLLEFRGAVFRVVLQMQRILVVSTKGMAGAGYEKDAEATGGRNNQADGRSP